MSTRLSDAAARGSAVALGAFALGAAASGLLHGYDPVRAFVTAPLPAAPRAAIEAILGGALVAFAAVGLPRSAARALAAALALVAALAAVDTARFYAALGRGTVATPAVVPASLLAAAALAALALSAWRVAAPPRWTLRRAALGAGVAAGTLAAIPLVLIACFGTSRYERTADCAVVLGARVYRDGRPSHALADRVDEAVRLYRDGRVRVLLMSGGVDPGNGRSEPQAMRARAEAAGVPREAIVLDEAGVDTAATARNAKALMRDLDLVSALVVTHYFHEPRTKLLLDRAGVRAYTVPARMSRRLLGEPWFVAREVAGYWVALGRA